MWTFCAEHFDTEVSAWAGKHPAVVVQGLSLRSLLRSFVLYYIMVHFGKQKTISAMHIVRLGRKTYNREGEQEG